MIPEAVNRVDFYGPYNASYLLNGSNSTTNVFSAIAERNYNFSLLFAGNLNTAFVLRIKNYSGAVASNFILRFMRAVNTAAGGKSVVWCFGNTTNSGSPNYFAVRNTNGIDLDADNRMNQDSFSTDTTTFYPVLMSQAVSKSAYPDKFPLVPLMVGIWKITGVYCHFLGYGLPATMGSDVENQTEVSIAGRRFIVTTLDAFANGYLNMGLIEVTD